MEGSKNCCTFAKLWVPCRPWLDTQVGPRMCFKSRRCQRGGLVGLSPGLVCSVASLWGESKVPQDRWAQDYLAGLWRDLRSAG